ncbi:MAG: adenylyltransferase/cytidyltransferase family protein, partial [Nitrosarchaeum sp.]
MTEFTLVAMGGTFDVIHRGHLTLLSKAFSISSKVIIGLTSDELAEKRGKKTLNKYEKRFETLTNTIKTIFPNSFFEISKLDNDFGPAVLEENVQALVVS